MEEKQTIKNKTRIRKVFLDDLPRWEKGNYATEGSINWEKSIGYKVKFTYDNITGEVKIDNYKNSYLYIRYKDNDIFKIDNRNFKNCKLGKLLGKITDDFKIKIGQILKDDKRDLIITNSEYRKDKKGCNLKWYKYKCNKCGWAEGWIIESSLLQGSGCSCCCIPSKTTVEGINSIIDTDPWMIKFFQGGYNEAKLYTRSSHQKIKPICPHCGKIKNNYIPISDIYKCKSISCYCNDTISYPEKMLYSVLKQLNINFKAQLTKQDFLWCNNYRYDFYIPSLNCIIETHGKQHYEEARISKGKWRDLEQEQVNDKLKKQLAIKNGISEEDYIIIDCRYSNLNFIKNNVLSSKLNKLFNLTNIDWLNCEEFALSSLVKKCCEIKGDNPNITTTEISELMMLSGVTIREYLKKGTKLGWCKYDAKQEAEKSFFKKGITPKNSKQVEIFNNKGEFLGVFKNCCELARQSERLFGVNLDSKHIPDVCNGKRTHHKGYTFKYVN